MNTIPRIPMTMGAIPRSFSTNTRAMAVVTMTAIPTQNIGLLALLFSCSIPHE